MSVRRIKVPTIRWTKYSNALWCKKIEVTRTLTTESLSVFMPMKVQEVQDTHGIYYGKNVISKNMILIN